MLLRHQSSNRKRDVMEVECLAMMMMLVVTTSEPEPKAATSGRTSCG